MTARWAPVAAAVALMLVWWGFGTQEALPPDHVGRGRPTGDFLSQYLPNAEYLGARLARGELPLWNPQHAGGAPFLAAFQVGALYPPNLLHAIWPGAFAFTLLAGLHLAWAVVAAAGLAAVLGADARGRLVAGLAWGTSLQVLGAAWLPPAQYAAAWAPAVFWGVERSLQAPSARRSAVLALTLGMVLLCGWPYGVAITCLGAGLHAGVRLVQMALSRGAAPLRPTLAALAGLAVGAGGGLLLAAPQLLPSWALLGQSCRALGSVMASQAIFVSAPHDPAVLLRSLLALGANDAVPGAFALLLLPFALAVPAPFRIRVAALLAAGLLGLLASFPRDVPVYDALRSLPVLGDFRFPYRYRLLTALALAVAAGVGTTVLAGLLHARPPLARAVAPAVLLLWLVSGALPSWRAAYPFARNAPPAITLAAEIEALGASPAPGRIFWTGRADRLRAGDPALVVHDLEPLTLARTARLLTWLEVGRPLTVTPPPTERPRVGDWLAVPFYGLLGPPRTPGRERILDLFSVGTLVVAGPPRWLSQRFQRVSPPGVAPAVYTNPRRLPRAYRVGTAIAEPRDPARALARLTHGAFDPRSRVMLDAVPPELAAARPIANAAPVEILRDEPERVVLRTRGTRPGVVVLADVWAPGWEARVDAEEQPLRRANLAFRGVVVPAGQHDVELVYRPRSLRVGAALALGTLLLLGGAVWREARRGRS